MELNELNANTRTLIVSFVVAIFGLIPLRFYEASQTMYQGYGDQVLGEVNEQVVLPPMYGEEVKEAPLFEAPYDTLESGTVRGVTSDCVTRGDMEDLIKLATSSDMTDLEKDSLINEIANLSVCE